MYGRDTFMKVKYKVKGVFSPKDSGYEVKYLNKNERFFSNSNRFYIIIFKNNTRKCDSGKKSGMELLECIFN